MRRLLAALVLALIALGAAPPRPATCSETDPLGGSHPSLVAERSAGSDLAALRVEAPTLPDPGTPAAAFFGALPLPGPALATGTFEALSVSAIASREPIPPQRGPPPPSV